MKHLLIIIFTLTYFHLFGQTVGVTYEVEILPAEQKKLITVNLTASGDFVAADGSDDWSGQTITIGFADDTGMQSLQPNPNITDLTSDFFVYQNGVGPTGSDIFTYTADLIGGAPNDGKVYMTLTSPGGIDKPLSDGQTVTAFSFKVPESYGTLTNDDIFLLEDNLQQSDAGVEPKIDNSGLDANVWNGVGFQSSLPITLKSFSANKESERSVLLEWVSSSEINASHYEVQRLNKFNEWKSIGNVKATGSTNVNTSYTYLDTEIDLRSVYDSDNSDDHVGVNYRLKMVDLDGATEYSDKDVVSLREFLGELTVYPNPTVNEVLVSIDNVSELGGKLTIHDNQGAVYKTQTLLSGKSDRVSMNEAPSGIYMLSVKQGEKEYTKKIVKID